MRLLRVQVPEFRALKDVDISFDPNFTPQVFPLGSLNGGGKSTFLQLVFILLHCSAHSDRHEFIANLLERVTIPEGDTSKLLARFELMEGGEKIELKFSLCNDDYLKGLEIDPVFNKEIVSFGVLNSTPIKDNAPSQSISSEEDLELAKRRMDFLEEEIKELYITNPVTATSSLRTRLEDPFTHYERSALSNAKAELKKLQQQLKKSESTDIKANFIISHNHTPLKNNILKTLESNHQLYITAWEFNSESLGLLCNFDNFQKDIEYVKKILRRISNQIFLSAPSSQIYLFLNRQAKSLLFKNTQVRQGVTYESALDSIKLIMSNFLTYDVFATNVVASLIEKARNQDFKTFVDTGINGTSYQQIIEELNILTQGKKVLPLLDENAAIIGIVFKNADDVEIYPEDLSHGELKRLSIYLWLKSLPSGENIVLMDEVENGFHPDWQYQIVRDLVEWGRDNQYILATHSYELCNALTPAHVKELEPKLVNN